MQWIMQERVDLARPTGLHRWPEQLMLPGDAQAHRWIVTVSRDGVPVDLTGWTIYGYMTRADNVCVPLQGAVDGPAAGVTLTDECYTVSGELRGHLQACKGDVRITLARGIWQLGKGHGDKIASGDVVPSLSELLAEIDGMREATQAANEASAEALAAAEDSAQRTTAAITQTQQHADAAIAQVHTALGTALDGVADALSEAAPAITDEVSGDVVTVTDAAARPALSLTSQINALQQGSGVPSPDNVRPIVGVDALTLTRTGRNMLDAAELRQVQVSTGETRWGMQYTQPGTYALHANVAGGDADYVYARVTDGSGAEVGDTMHLVTTSVVRSYTVTLEAGQTLTVWYVRDLDQATAADCMSRAQVQVEMGSRTAYVPGQSAVLTADLPETVYGGTIDWSTGLLTVTHAQRTISETIAVYSNQADEMIGASIQLPGCKPEAREKCLCDKLKPVVSPVRVLDACISVGFGGDGHIGYIALPKTVAGDTFEALTAWLTENPINVVYPLATPRTIQLTPQQLGMLRGHNTIWGNSGITTLGYIADTRIYIDNAVAVIAASVINA